MSELQERSCVVCGAGEESMRLEVCTICRRPFCPDCAHKAGFGRKFCSPECVRNYYFTGEPDDDEDAESE